MPRFRTVWDVTDRGTRHDREKRQTVFKLKNDRYGHKKSSAMEIKQLLDACWRNDKGRPNMGCVRITQPINDRMKTH
jgi:hypothetical protein